MQVKLKYDSNNYLKLVEKPVRKPTDKLELEIISPANKKEISGNDVTNFYKNLINIFADKS